MATRRTLDPTREHLIFLYGESTGRATFDRLRAVLDRYRLLPPVDLSPDETGGQADAVLITYGDQICAPGKPPLCTLAEFAKRRFSGLVNTMHILPFYPYSSDDGFAVIDYRTVDPTLGSWEDVDAIKQNFRLMFDAVINHISARSEWFQRFLRDDPAYRDWFIVVDEDVDLSQVVRPRALPLLTRVNTPSGPKQVWTTFSDDQIDLNFSNPDVLLEIIDLLLFYVSRGAQMIRLDAIAYLWKEIGTSCIHLPQTHRVIQLWRDVFDEVAPHVALITETNVPHVDNVSYFGDGRNEAQMVYNFALPPLTLHAIHTGDARILSRWAASLTLPSNRVTFFNFLASHDGIGLNPARGILEESDIDVMVERVRAHGGFVSMKANADGSSSPYELNVNYFDALSDPNGTEPIDLQVDRFIASQAIMLALVGVPGIYVHSLLGSRGDPAGVGRTGRYRSINRQKFDLEPLERELADPDSLRSRVLRRYTALLRARASQPAFDPHGEQRIIEVNSAIFAVLRFARGNGPDVLCLHNVSDQSQTFRVALDARVAVDLLSDQAHETNALRELALTLRPCQVVWLSLTR